MRTTDDAANTLLFKVKMGLYELLRCYCFMNVYSQSGDVFIIMLLSLYYYMKCIICCRVVKEASHEFKERTGDLS